LFLKFLQIYFIFLENHISYSNPNSVQEFSFTQRPQRKEAQSSTETNLSATFAKNAATFA